MGRVRFNLGEAVRIINAIKEVPLSEWVYLSGNCIGETTTLEYRAIVKGVEVDLNHDLWPDSTSGSEDRRAGERVSLILDGDYVEKEPADVEKAIEDQLLPLARTLKKQFGLLTWDEQARRDWARERLGANRRRSEVKRHFGLE